LDPDLHIQVGESWSESSWLIWRQNQKKGNYNKHQI